MMGGGKYIRQQSLNAHSQVNTLSSMGRVKYSSHRVLIYGAPGTVSINEGNTNSATDSYGINWVLLQPTHIITDLFGFESVNDKPTSEGVHIGTCVDAYDIPSNHKTYILVQNKMLFFVD